MIIDTTNNLSSSDSPIRAETYSDYDPETGKLWHEYNQEAHFVLLAKGDYWALTCGEGLVADSERNEGPDAGTTDAAYAALAAAAKNLPVYDPSSPDRINIGFFAEDLIQDLEVES